MSAPQQPDKEPEKKVPKPPFEHRTPELSPKKLNFKYNMKIYLGMLDSYKRYVIPLLFLLLLYQATSALIKYLFSLSFEIIAAFGAKDLVWTELRKSLSFHIYDYRFDIVQVFIISVIIVVLSKVLNMHLVNRLDAGLISDLKMRFFNHLIELDHYFHTSNKSGAVISKLMRGSNSIVDLTDVFIYNLLPLIFKLVIAIGTLLYLDMVSALIIGIVCLLYIGFGVLISSIQQGASLAANDAEDDEKAIISDMFTNIETVKYFGKENTVKRKFAKIVEFVRYSLLKHWDYFRILDFGQTLILYLGIFPLIYFWVDGIIAKTLALSTIIYIFSLYIPLEEDLSGFVQGIRHFYLSMAGFESLFQYLKVKNEIVDKPNAKKLKVIKGAIRFEKVSFTYPNKKKPVLSNFTLDIKPGMDVAIVGPSGAGKSTLMRVLFRLYNLDSGRILIDGQDISECKQESLRSALGIVPQECILFADSIVNNVAFSNPRASKGRIDEAMEFAQLQKVVKNFSKKEKTLVGERGNKLSGGEKQRVSIARALLENPKILVLDEATSSLDSQTEHEIQKALEKLKRRRTTLTIAHRLSTIKKADLIVVMDKGRIVGIGKHDNLLKRNRLYKKLWSLQKGNYLKKLRTK